MSAAQGRLLLFVLLAVVGFRSTQAAYYDDEKGLRTAVLTGYEYKIRPATSVTCNVRLSLLNINILDVTGQRLSVSGWLTVRWNDPRLVWTPATHGGIEDFYDTELVLWRPELIVDNEISNLDILENDKLLIRATSSGGMTWEPPGIFETHCDVDVTFYPFDTQLCIIEVTSWSYTLDEIDLSARDTHIYLEDFEKSGEWEILDTWTERRLLLDGSEYHSQLDFHMRLRRRPSYYVMTILIPVIVTSILGILVFLLPAETGEKVGYTLTILLTYVVMLTLVAGYLPPTSKSTSLLSIYLTIILFLGVFSTLATVFILYLHHHDEDVPIRDWMQAVWSKVLIPIAGWRRKVHPRSDGQNGRDGESPDVYISSPPKNRNSRVHPSSAVSSGSSKVDGKQPIKVRPQGEGQGNASSDRLKWVELAFILDTALFRVLSIFIFVLTLVILLALVIGGYSYTPVT